MCSGLRDDDISDGRKRSRTGRPVGYVHGGAAVAVADGSDDEASTGTTTTTTTAHIAALDALPVNRGRAVLVHDLIAAYGLLPALTLLAPHPATDDEMAQFHDRQYLAALDGPGRGRTALTAEELDEYGLTDDCAPFPRLKEHCRWVAGGTLAAARALCEGEVDVAIHWGGGRHHAHRDAAAGFCFVNDIVLGILELQERFARVLYVDLDLHHGDGVEEAFEFTSSVVTVSFHHHAPGFFPGSGAVDERSNAINVPLRSRLGTAAFVEIAHDVLDVVHARFRPDAVVVQCGCDGLNEDPWQTFNLTIDAFERVLDDVLDWSLPTLLLGGGGYHPANAARCWATLTARCLAVRLPDELPAHDRLAAYAPGCLRAVPAGPQLDGNTRDHLDALRLSVLSRVMSRLAGA